MEPQYLYMAARKKCTKCKRYLLSSCFSFSKSSKSGLESNCRDCKNAVRSAYDKANPLHKLYRSIKSKEPQTDLTPEYLYLLWELQGGRCYFYGIPMQWTAFEGKNPMAVSVDRLDLAKPHQIGNVALTTVHSNLGRNRTPADVYLLFVKNVLHMMPLCLDYSDHQSVYGATIEPVATQW